VVFHFPPKSDVTQPQTTKCSKIHPKICSHNKHSYKIGFGNFGKLVFLAQISHSKLLGDNFFVILVFCYWSNFKLRNHKKLSGLLPYLAYVIVSCPKKKQLEICKASYEKS